MHRINARSFKRPLNKRPSKIWKNLTNAPLLNTPFQRTLLLNGVVCLKCRCKEGGVNFRQPRNGDMEIYDTIP